MRVDDRGWVSRRWLAWSLRLARIAVAAGAALVVGLPAQADRGRGQGQLRIDEIMAGANGDSQLQYIELSGPRRRAWVLPWRRRRDAEPRAVLRFHDASGAQTGEFFVPQLHSSHRGQPLARRRILLATQAFAEQFALEPDLVMARQLSARDGAICLHRSHPGRRERVDCVAYGNFQGSLPADACVALAPALPIAGEAPVSLTRQPAGGAKSEACSATGVYTLSEPSPRNGAGRGATILARSLVEQGQSLFELETFAGNGRTCSTCHVAADSFGLAPESIAVFFAEDPLDPLFIAENAPALAELENACLMRMGDLRGLILENISGFDHPPVFRRSPHLLNVEATAPYGLSGDFPDLQSFSSNAVRQHFPKTLERNSDPLAGPLDFREPTQFEREALEAFMQAIRFPADGDLDPERMIDAAVERGTDESAIRRGQDLFFGATGSAQCFRCHSGPTLSDADGSLGRGAGNLEFDIGIGFLPRNTDDGCAGGPGDPSLALPGDFRRFSISPLLGIARFEAFFHDNSVPDLRSAVAHYTSLSFRFSEAGLLMERFRIEMTGDEVDDVVAFLEALSVDPSPPLAPDVAIGVDPFAEGDPIHEN